MNSRFFDLEEISMLFQIIQMELKDYLEQTTKNPFIYNYEVEALILEKLEDTLEIFSSIKNEPFLCLFRGFGDLIGILEKSNCFEVKQRALKLCILLLQSATIPEGILLKILESTQTFPRLARQIIAFSKHVNVFNSKDIGLLETALFEDSALNELYISVKESPLNKRIVYLSDIESSALQDLERINFEIKKITETSTDDLEQATEMSSFIFFRLQLKMMKAQDPNLQTKLIKLSLLALNIFHKTDNLKLGNQISKCLKSVFQEERRINLLPSYMDILKIINNEEKDELFAVQVMENYIGIMAAETIILIDERSAFFFEILTVINQETMRRRTPFNLEEKTSTSKQIVGERFVSSYFTLLFDFLCIINSKPEQEEHSDFSTQILSFLDKSIQDCNEGIFLVYSPDVIILALKVVYSEQSIPGRTLKSLLGLLSTIVKTKKIQFVDSETSQYVEITNSQFNDLCVYLLKSINIIREDYVAPGFRTNLANYIQQFNEAEFWGLVMDHTKTNSDLKSMIMKVLIDYFDELPLASFNTSLEVFTENKTLSKLLYFIKETDTLDVHDYLYAVYFCSKVYPKLEEEIKELNIIDIITTRIFSYPSYKKLYLEHKGSPTAQKIYSALAEGLLFFANVNNEEEKNIEGVFKLRIEEISKIAEDMRTYKTSHNAELIQNNSLIKKYWGEFEPVNFFEKERLFDLMIRDSVAFFFKLFNSTASNFSRSLINKKFIRSAIELYFHSGEHDWLDHQTSSFIHIKIIFSAQGNHSVFTELMEVATSCLQEKVDALISASSSLSEFEIEMLFIMYYDLKKVLKYEENQSLSPIVRILEQVAFIASFIHNLLAAKSRAYGGMVNGLGNCEKYLFAIIDSFVTTIIPRFNVPRARASKKLTMKGLHDLHTHNPEGKALQILLTEFEKIEKSRCPIGNLSTLIINLFDNAFGQLYTNMETYIFLISRLNAADYSDEDEIVEFDSMATGYRLYLNILKYNAPAQNYVDIYQNGIVHKAKEILEGLVSIANRIISKKEFIITSTFKKMVDGEEESRQISLEDIYSWELLNNKGSKTIGNFGARLTSLFDLKAPGKKLVIKGENIKRHLVGDYYRFVRYEYFEFMKDLLLNIATMEKVMISHDNSQGPFVILKQSEPTLKSISSTASSEAVISQLLVSLTKCLSIEAVELSYYKVSTNKNNPEEGFINENVNKLKELGFSDSLIEKAVDSVYNPIIMEELFEWLLANEGIEEGNRNNLQGFNKHNHSHSKEKEGIFQVLMIPSKRAVELISESFRDLCIEIFRSVVFLRNEVHFGEILKVFLLESSKKNETIFLYELYYIYIDTANLILNSFVKTRLEKGGYFNEFQLILPGIIKRENINWGIDKSVSLNIQCRDYDAIQATQDKVYYLLNDSLILINKAFDILNIASNKNWAPCGASELTFLANFLMEMTNIMIQVGEEKREEYFYAIAPNTSKLMNAIFEFIIKLLMLEMKPNNDLNLLRHNKGEERSIASWKEKKEKLCLRIIKGSKFFFRANKLASENFGIPFLESKAYCAYIKMVAQCFTYSSIVKKHFLTHKLFSHFMRTNFKIKGESKNLLVALKDLLFCIIVDEELIESSIESEILFYFYALQRTNYIERKKLASDEPNPTLDQNSVDFKSFISSFGRISKAHPLIFKRVHDKLCITKGVSRGIEAKYSIQLKEDDLSKFRGAGLHCLSSKTKNAITQIINEIIYLWINKIETVLDGRKHTIDKNLPKALTKVFIEIVVQRVPLLGLVISKYDCLRIFTNTATHPRIVERVAGLKKLTFVSFLLRVVVYFNPGAMKDLWTFINDTHVLIKVKEKLRPLSHEFRANILREMAEIGDRAAEDIKRLFESEEDSRNEINAYLSIRTYSSIVLHISQHYSCLRALLGRQFSSINTNELKCSVFRTISSFSPIKLSRYWHLLRLSLIPITLLQRYSSLFSSSSSPPPYLPISSSSGGDSSLPLSLPLPSSLLWVGGLCGGVRFFSFPTLYCSKCVTPEARVSRSRKKYSQMARALQGGHETQDNSAELWNPEDHPPEHYTEQDPDVEDPEVEEEEDDYQDEAGADAVYFNAGNLMIDNMVGRGDEAREYIITSGDVTARTLEAEGLEDREVMFKKPKEVYPISYIRENPANTHNIYLSDEYRDVSEKEVVQTCNSFYSMFKASSKDLPILKYLKWSQNVKPKTKEKDVRYYTMRIREAMEGRFQNIIGDEEIDPEEWDDEELVIGELPQIISENSLRRIADLGNRPIDELAELFQSPIAQLLAQRRRRRDDPNLQVNSIEGHRISFGGVNAENLILNDIEVIEEHNDEDHDDVQTETETDDDMPILEDDTVGAGESELDGTEINETITEDNTQQLTQDIDELNHMESNDEEVDEIDTDLIEIRDHVTQMPSHCSPAPELNSNIASRAEPISAPGDEISEQLEEEYIEEDVDEENELQNNEIENQSDSQPNLPEITFDFSAMGLPTNFLQLAGIDPEYFSCLPYELQMDIVYQHINVGGATQNFIPPNQAIQNPQIQEDQTEPGAVAGNQQVHISSNRSPAELAQSHRTPTQPTNTEANTSNNTERNSPRRVIQEPTENANMVFLATLTPDLRQEVLMTCPDDFVASLPPNIQDEARRLRETVIIQSQMRERQRQLLRINEIEEEEYEDKYGSEVITKAFKNLPTDVNTLEDDELAGLIRMLCANQNIESFYSIMIASFALNPLLEKKIIHTLLFLLINDYIHEEPILELLENTIYERGQPKLVGEKMKHKYDENLIHLIFQLSFSHQETFVDCLLKDNGLQYYPNQIKMLLKQNEKNFKYCSLEGLLEKMIDGNVSNSHTNSELLLGALENIASDLVSVDDKGELFSTLEISSRSISLFCQLMSSKHLKEKSFSLLANIISYLCYNQTNLDSLIEQISISITQLTRDLSVKLDKGISLLKGCKDSIVLEKLQEAEFELLQMHKADSSSDETRLFKMFKMVLKLFEKSVETETKKGAESNEAGSDKKANSDKTESLSKEVRDKFTALTNNRSIKKLWLNICEMMSELEALFLDNLNVLDPMLKSLTPAISSFFIMYKILCDDEMIKDVARLYSSSQKKMKISALKIDEEGSSTKSIILEESYDELMLQDLDINQILLIFCERNKKLLNKIIRDNIELLNGPLSVIPKVLIYSYVRNSLIFWILRPRESTSS